MKAYIITDKDIQQLHDKLKMEKFVSNEHFLENRTLVDEIFRFFNYHVRNWVDEISK